MPSGPRPGTLSMGAHANQTACVRRRKNELNLKDAGVQVAQLNVRMKAGTLPLGLQYTRTLKAAVAFRICWPHKCPFEIRSRGCDSSMRGAA
eukprot:scaffold47341_cov24-Tisochrysis_lutea.AAC.1